MNTQVAEKWGDRVKKNQPQKYQKEFWERD